MSTVNLILILASLVMCSVAFAGAYCYQVFKRNSLEKVKEVFAEKEKAFQTLSKIADARDRETDLRARHLSDEIRNLTHHMRNLEENNRREIYQMEHRLAEILKKGEAK